MKYLRNEVTSKHGFKELPVFMLNPEELRILSLILNVAYNLIPKGFDKPSHGRIRDMRKVIGSYLKEVTSNSSKKAPVETN
jgi:hypothetical protein